MNKCILVGRLASDLTVRQTADGSPVTSGSIAVTKKFKDQNGERGANFINFVSFRNTANALATYVRKGDRVGLIGSWETRSYQAQDGTTRYVNELFVEEIEFLQDKREEQQQYQQGGYYQQQAPSRQAPARQPQYQQQAPVQQYQDDRFANVEKQFEVSDEDLPF